MTLYASVLVSKFPNRALALFNYMQIIRTASVKFRVLAWYAYDIEFRRRAAKNPGVNWGQRDMQLTLTNSQAYTVAQGSCFTCGSADHLAEDCPLSVPFNRSVPQFQQRYSVFPHTLSLPPPLLPRKLWRIPHQLQPTYCRAVSSPSIPWQIAAQLMLNSWNLTFLRPVYTGDFCCDLSPFDACD